MMVAYVVTEGPSDAALLALMLRALDVRDLDTRIAGGKNVASSFARSLAVSKNAHVAVVLDSDTMDDSMIREYELIFNDLTRTSGSRAGCKLFQAKPNLEEDLFRDYTDYVAIFGELVGKSQTTDLSKNGRLILQKRMKSVLARPTHLDLYKINQRVAAKMLERSALRGLVTYLREAEQTVVSR